MLTRETDKYRSAQFFSRLKKFRRGFWGDALFILLFLACLVDLASADSINGNLEFRYTTFDSTTEGAAGNTTRTTSKSYNQKYNLQLNKTIFPNLSLDAGGLFEKTGL